MVEVVDEGVGGGDEASEGDGLGEAPGSRPPATMARYSGAQHVLEEKGRGGQLVMDRGFARVRA